MQHIFLEIRVRQFLEVQGFAQGPDSETLGFERATFRSETQPPNPLSLLAYMPVTVTFGEGQTRPRGVCLTGVPVPCHLRPICSSLAQVRGSGGNGHGPIPKPHCADTPHPAVA